MSHRSRSSSRICGSSSHAITGGGSNGAEVPGREWLGASLLIAISTTRRSAISLGLILEAKCQ